MWNLTVCLENESIYGEAISNPYGRKVLLNYISYTFGDHYDSLHDFINTYFEGDIIYITPTHMHELVDEKENLSIIGINLIVKEER